MYYLVSGSNKWDHVVLNIARFPTVRRMLHQAKGKKKKKQKSNLRCKVELISNENLRGQCLNKRVKFLFLPFHLIYLLLLLFFLSIKLKPRDNDYPSNVSLQVATLLLAVWDALTDIDRTLNCFFFLIKTIRFSAKNPQ